MNYKIINAITEIKKIKEEQENFFVNQRIRIKTVENIINEIIKDNNDVIEKFAEPTTYPDKFISEEEEETKETSEYEKWIK